MTLRQLRSKCVIGHGLLFAGLFFSIPGTVARSGLVTFSISGGKISANGLPPGIVATVSGFGLADVESIYNDDFAIVNGQTDWGLFGITSEPTIAFTAASGSPASIDLLSLSISQGDFGDGGATLTGSLRGSTVFGFPNASDSSLWNSDLWQPVQGGSVDTITFTDFSDVWLNDVTVSDVPEPNQAIAVVISIALFCRQRRSVKDRLN